MHGLRCMGRFVSSGHVAPLAISLAFLSGSLVGVGLTLLISLAPGGSTYGRKYLSKRAFASEPQSDADCSPDGVRR